ncbi:hypothetical protein [Actinophytocola glycyrrhizae]|uniref:hypothetical protein n=1 Tax=Actinophytocola glycyrrhizae TaxID=2044873 RepID=UPI00366E8644
MKSLRAKLVGSVLVGLAAVGASVPAAAAEPSAGPLTVRAIELGGLGNLIGYCNAQGTLTATPTDYEDAYSWVCIAGGGGQIEIDMDDACRWHYKDHPGAWGKPIDDSRPFSWVCYD